MSGVGTQVVFCNRLVIDFILFMFFVGVGLPYIYDAYYPFHCFCLAALPLRCRFQQYITFPQKIKKKQYIA
jgi:hypothetical protein